MKKFIVLLGLGAWCFGWAFFGSAFAKKTTQKAAPSKTAVTETKKSEFTDPNTVIQVTEENPTFTLKIKSNPTTGYMWFLSHHNADLVTPVSSRYVPPTSELAGASGYMEWTFKVNSQAFSVPQLTNISLEYIRPWVVADSTQKLDFRIAIEPKRKSVKEK